MRLVHFETFAPATVFYSMADQHAPDHVSGISGLLWVLQAMRPAFAVAIGEGLVVVVEGLIIYGICWLLGPANSTLPRPTIAKCWMASFACNVCSAVAFPILVAIFERFGPN